MLDMQAALDALDHIDPAVKRMAWDIVDREGGLSDNPADSGGITNHGESLRHAQSEGLLFDLNGDGRVDAADIRLVTPAIAVADFLVEYFVEPQLGKLPACIQACVFDHAVTGGPAAAVRLAQQEANRLGAQPRLVEDGVIGPNTILAVHRAADSAGPARMLAGYVAQRCAEYQAIAARNPKDQAFLKGWLARASSFLPAAAAPVAPAAPKPVAVPEIVTLAGHVGPQPPAKTA